MSDNQTDVRIAGHDETGPAFDSASKHVEDFSNHVKEVTGEAVEAVMEKMAELLAIKELFQSIKEGIKFADEIRDLKASVEVFSTSTEEAAKSIEFFEEAMDRTRSTGDEMLKMYRDLLPRALKSMSESTLREVTVNLSQVATLVGKAPEEMENAFKLILGGRIRGTNPILMALGLTKEQIKAEGGMDLLIGKLHELGEKGAQLGDSFESSMHKAKDVIMHAFAEGFNSARDDAKSGMDSITQTLKDPKFLKAVHDIGQTVAMVMPAVAVGIEAAVAMIKGTIGTVQLIWGKALQWLTESAAGWLQMLERAAVAVGATGIAQHLHSAAGFAEDLAAGFRATADAGQKMTVESYSTLLNIFKSSDAAKDLSKSAEESVGHVKDLGDQSGKMKEKIESAKEAMDQLNNSMEHQLSNMSLQGQGASAAPYMKAWLDYQKVIEDAGFKANEASLKVDAAFKVLGESPSIRQAWKNIALIRQEAEKLANIKMNAELLKLVNDSPGGFKERQAEELNQAIEGMKRIDEMTLEHVRNTVGAILDVIKQRSDDWRNAMQAGFVDLAETGGKNFGQIAAEWFNRNVSSGASSFGDKMLNGLVGVIAKLTGRSFSGKARQGSDGKWYVDGSDQAYGSEAEANANSSIGQGIQTAYGIGAGALASKQAAYQHPQGSITAAGVQGFMAGMASGNYYVAIASAVASMIGAYAGKQQSREEYKYAIPAIDEEGNVSLDRPGHKYNRPLSRIRGMKNVPNQIPDAEAEEMINQIQETYDKFRNGFVAILMKFPEALIPKLTAIDGKFQDNPSAHFMEHFQQWLTHTLPDELEGQFHDSMETAYTKMGLSVEAFGKLWDKFGDLSPDTRLKVWGDLADALINFQKAGAIMTGTHMNMAPDIFGGPGFYKGPWSGPGGGQALRAERDNAFLSSLTQSDERIMTLATHLRDLTGEAQIAALKELSQLTLAKAESEKAALIQLATLADSIRESFTNAINDRRVKGMTKADGSPDFDKIAEFYTSQANSILKKLPTITDPAVLAQMQQQFIQFINAAADAAAQGSPGKANDINEWAIGALQAGMSAFNDAIDALGNKISSEGDAFFTNLKPYFTTFADDLEKLADPIGDVGDGLDGLKGPIDRFRIGLDGLSDTIDQINGRLGGGGNYANSVVGYRAAS